MITKSKIIKPPQMMSKGGNLNGKYNATIFLGGSIEMGKAENWQEKVEKYLANSGSLILNPRRDDWDSSWEQTYENAQFYQQVSWEMDAQDASDYIIYNFVGETMSPITLLELGCYASQSESFKKIMVACPDDFWRKGNVEVFCERFAIPVYDSLDELLKDLKEHITVVPN